MSDYSVLLEINTGSGKSTKLAGGVILSSEYVLTAAHNLVDSSNKPISASSVMIGYGSGQRSEQTNTTGAGISIHPNFVTSKNTLDYTNDIALIKVPVLSLYASTSMAKIYNGNLNPGQSILTVGWGNTESNAALQGWLRGAVTTIGDDDECAKYIDGYTSSNGAQICSYDVSNPKDGANVGDAGSAIIVSQNGQALLAGIVSQVVYYANPNGSILGIAHVDINVNNHISFITSVTGLSSDTFY
ncbi:hypothetical protein EV175_001054 [Coemansia sp. RSA 1933]|nr:hypothetical protein EV175_001054 [Coemansia sp. RSA 1933]